LLAVIWNYITMHKHTNIKRISDLLWSLLYTRTRRQAMYCC